MRIRLIEPTRYLESGRLLKAQRLFLPSLTLPLLAALTPSDIKVSIQCEHFEDINFDEKVDLIGITGYTSRMLRAYEIADEFRKRGVPVVMGGIHVSMMPDEAQKHADTVIVGEAEETWPRFIDDFRKGVSKRLYAAETQPSLANLPVPRFSLVEKYKSRYLSYSGKGIYRLLPMPALPIQTARGCPYSCDFCSVTAFSGRHYRTRPVSEVINEIRTLGARGCFFVDDNIFGNPTRARELCEALIPLKITWLGQSTVSAARDTDLLKLARRSGCAVLFIGLESLSRKGLESVNKSMNKVDEYAANLKACRKQGISVIASLIFGFDGDEATAFRAAYDFLMKHRIPYTLWSRLVPLPGTTLYKRAKEEGLLTDDTWWLNPQLVSDFLAPRFVGTRGTSGELFQHNFYRYYRRFYSMGSIVRRILLPPQARFLPKIHFNLVARRKITRGKAMIES